MSEALDEMSTQAPADPDAQATVTDFLDYTEYLPSDLIRSLTLIRKLDEFYLDHSSRIHDLTKTYGSLPSLPSETRPDPQYLRSQISRNLDQAITSRESSHAEASRLYDVVDRHFNRLTSIITKLRSLPQPPSRDPSPVPQPTVLSQAQRSRSARKADTDEPPTPRITLRLDGARQSDPNRQAVLSNRHKNRNRRVTIPGEVLPPPNPDSPPPSSESDWESSPPSPVPIPTSRVGAPSRREKSRPAARVKVPKLPKPPKIKPPKPPRIRRPTGVMGTNVHSAVAGISTSNALALLKPPPEGTVPGSEDAPWLKLTAWEMAKLRKRMKKNAVWNPSETMIRRELADLGRGPDNYHAAKAKAESSGEPFVDAANIAETANQPGKRVLAEGEISVDSLGMEEIQLSNRGMKLNEAKKLKKENLLRELALQAAADGEIQTPRRVTDSANTLKTPIPHKGGQVGDFVTDLPTKDKEASRSASKRKRDPTPPLENEQATTEAINLGKSKKRRTEPPPNVLTGNTTVKIPLAAPGVADTPTPRLSTTSPKEQKAPALPPSRRRASIAPRVQSPDNAPSRPRSRGTTSPVEPTTAGKDRPRRSSAVAIPTAEPAQATRPTSRRGKRPVPGRLTAESSEGGAAVIVGRRAAAPRKKLGAKKLKDEEKGVDEREDEGDDEGLPVDPNEPRYCLCGDVSWGTMVMCENSDVSVVLRIVVSIQS
ncbi:MAG: hypothetical protein M1837_002296 [Sclerophora amabilis]|nr:MAG: hypothetical protein M1837_002296 [Sclerophora amabilis]